MVSNIPRTKKTTLREVSAQDDYAAFSATYFQKGLTPGNKKAPSEN